MNVQFDELLNEIDDVQQIGVFINLTMSHRVQGVNVNVTRTAYHHFVHTTPILIGHTSSV